MILIINKNKGMEFAPYADRYKLFTDSAKAVEYAIQNGYEDRFGLGLNLKPGMNNMIMYGDVNLEILSLEVSDV